MELLTRDEARLQGLVSYSTGIPCSRGHIAKRYTNTGICYECKRLQNKRFNDSHKGWLAEYSKSQYVKHKSKKNELSHKWAQQNPDKTRDIKRKNKKTHHDKYLEAEKIRQRTKRQEDPMWRLNKNISKALWHTMQNGKEGKTWKECVNFTLEELKIHLESNFRDGMSWDNYGYYWHVDHVKPISRCRSIEETWALTNLQPLLANENLSKGNRYIG